MSTLSIDIVRQNLIHYAPELHLTDDAITRITNDILEHLGTQKVYKVPKALSPCKIRIIPSGDISKGPRVMIYLAITQQSGFKVYYRAKDLLDQAPIKTSDSALGEQTIASSRVEERYSCLLENESEIIKILASDPESEKYVSHTDFISVPIGYHGSNKNKRDTVKMLTIQDGVRIDLVDFEEKQGLTSEYCLKFSLKILEILSYLKSKGIVYGDVKADNFIVVPDPTDDRLPLTIKLTDFYLSRMLSSPLKITWNSFISPELAKAHLAKLEQIKDPSVDESLLNSLFNNILQCQTYENDGWSAGVLLALLCKSFLSMSTQGKISAIYSPISQDIEEQTEKIAQIDPKKWLDKPVDMSFETIIYRLLAYNPQERMPIEEARDLFKVIRVRFLEKTHAAAALA
ncbi:MAG: hypothetical protein HZB76_00795 [Chlamydiae bacterium]|nr:hypothetical protein [Chlamydiota bacterium]